MPTALASPAKSRLDFQALQQAVLKALQARPEPRPLPRVLEELAGAGQTFDDIEARRAVWSLIANHRLALTDDWRLSLP